MTPYFSRFAKRFFYSALEKFKVHERGPTILFNVCGMLSHCSIFLLDLNRDSLLPSAADQACGCTCTFVHCAITK